MGVDSDYIVTYKFNIWPEFILEGLGRCGRISPRHSGIEMQHLLYPVISAVHGCRVSSSVSMSHFADH